MDPSGVAKVIFELEKLKKEEKQRLKEEKLKEEEDFIPELEEEDEEDKEEVKEFNFHAKTVFLTYPHTDDMTQEDILECLDEKFPDMIKEYDMCLEKHKDGENHIHAMVTFKEKIHTRRQDAFDAYWYHPNIQSAKNRNAVKKYIYKGGPKGEPPNVLSNRRFDWEKTGGFKKRREDYIAYQREMLLAKKDTFKWPLTVYGYEFRHDPASEKKCNFWFYGAADMGKTYQMEKAVCKFKVKKRGTDIHPWEGLTDEEVLLCDDNPPKTDTEIKIMTGRYLNATQVSGASRYTPTYLPIDKRLVMIVIDNDPPGIWKGDNTCDWRQMDWFKSRFFVYRLEKKENGEIEVFGE